MTESQEEAGDNLVKWAGLWKEWEEWEVMGGNGW